jgi:hypothetical protein
METRDDEFVAAAVALLLVADAPTLRIRAGRLQWHQGPIPMGSRPRSLFAAWQLSRAVARAALQRRRCGWGS